MNLPAETFRFMSPLDLHVLSTPPAFVLSQDQTLMFNPYPQLHAYSRTARQSRPLSPFRQGVSLFQNLTVIDASSRLPALFVDFFLVQNDFLCIVFKDRLLSFASLADSLIIITNTPYVVNPFFATFRLFNILRPFLSLFSSIMLPKSLFPQFFILLSCLFPSIIEISVAHGHKCKERFL